jgi:hypothetical protein
MPFALVVEDWETLKQLSKKFDLLCLVKETAETEVHSLIGAKYKADHISETHIEFNITKAVGGKEALKEYFGEAKEGEAFYQKMRELYQQNGVTVYYAKHK